jgi:hypothetical protein
MVFKFYGKPKHLDTTINEAKSPNWYEKSPRFQLNLLQQDSIKYLYQKRLTEELNILPVKDVIDEEHDNLTKAILKDANEALGKIETRRPVQIWWISEIAELVAEKKRMYQKWLTNKTVEYLVQHKHSNARVKRKITEEKNKTWTRKCQEIESLLGGLQSFESWRFLKTLKTNQHSRNFHLVTMSDFENHHKTLLSENREEYGVCFSPQPLEASSLEIDMTDMEIAIQSLKNKKSPGPGMITKN